MLNDYFLFNMGDHGGVVVAVRYFRLHGQTRQLLFSTDEGERWQNVTFSDDDLRIYGLMTEPGENTTIFTMFGSSRAQHQWLIIKIDLRTAFSESCSCLFPKLLNVLNITESFKKLFSIFLMQKNY